MSEAGPPPYDYGRSPSAQNPYNHGRNPFHHDPDSDPEEEDIENHISHGPGGFFAHRSVYRSPEADNPENEGRARPEDGDDVFRRFTQLLGNISGPGMPGRPRPNPFLDEPGRTQVRVTRFTNRPFPGGVSSFSITTGGTRPLRSDGSPMPEDDPFQSYASTPRVRVDVKQATCSRPKRPSSPCICCHRRRGFPWNLETWQPSTRPRALRSCGQSATPGQSAKARPDVVEKRPPPWWPP